MHQSTQPHRPEEPGVLASLAVSLGMILFALLVAWARQLSTMLAQLFG